MSSIIPTFAPVFASDSETRALEKSVRNKLDLRVLPLLSLLYLVNFLDRTNIGNAKIAGLVTDIHLTGTQFNISITITYVLYVACIIPSNWVLKRVGPNRWLAALTCAWSIITICTGFVQSFGGLVAVRLLLGACEGGVVPGVTLYLSTLYTRHELQTRIALFWSPATVAGAFGGLLASAIILMDGVGGLAGWRWIFILEGIVSFMVGVLLWLTLPKSIDSVGFLTISERELAAARLKMDMEAADKVGIMPFKHESQAAEKDTEFLSSSLPVTRVESGTFTLRSYEKFEWIEVRRGLLDIHAWLIAIAYFGGYVSVFSLAYFIPSIVAGLGYTGSEAQLRTVPPYVVATVATVGVAVIADRYKMRLPIIMILLLIAISGYALALAAETDQVRYGALFLMTVGVFPTAPCTLAITANNASGHYKRATAIALMVSFSAMGGFLSTFVYTPDQAPHYRKGHSIVLGLLCSSFVLMGTALLYCIWENKMRAAGRRDGNIAAYHALWEANKTRAPIGDRHPDFRYTL